MVFFTHSACSIRWYPVHSVPGSTSLTRASIFGSRSPNDSATGSIRSQYVRETGNNALALATSPALTAATNSVVFCSSATACEFTYRW